MEFVVLPDGGFALDMLISWTADGEHAVIYTLRHGEGMRYVAARCPAGVFAAAVRFACEERFERSQGRRLPVEQIMQQADLMRDWTPVVSADAG